MEPHIEIIATVTAPDGSKQTVPAGSVPVWSLPLTPAWKKSYKAAIFEAVGHYPTPGDSWRVRFAPDFSTVTN